MGPKIVMMELTKLVEYPTNAKTHPPEQLNKIATSIKEFGFRNPVLIDSGNNIIAGHGRLYAAQQLGISKVPCIKIDDLSEAQVKAFRLADNRTAQSDWDFDLLSAEILELDGMDIDLDLTGFDHDELLDMLGKVEIPADNKAIDEEAMENTEHECPKCGFKW